MIDLEFQQSVAGWQHDRWALRALFATDELQRLEEARRRLRNDRRTIVYCVYENPFAKSGGLFAVAQNLPPALQERNRAVVVLSPLHARLKRAPVKPENSAASPLVEGPSTTVTFGDQTHALRLWEHRDDSGTRWILFEATGFFEAAGGPQGLDPYDYTSSETPEAPSLLARDSLFASAAVPRILAALGMTEDVVLHPQDWQFASTALTVKEAILDGSLQSAVVVLTSHNPYDNPLPEEQLALITRRTEDSCWPSLRVPELPGAIPRRETFYECMLPLLDAPCSTVSRNFARELTADPLQTVHFTNHLQAIFARQGMVGVNNGLFLKPTAVYSDEALEQARHSQPQLLLQQKRDLRRKMLALWSSDPPRGVTGSLDGGPGRELRELPDTVPIFMMFGRMDPGQKGFDVLARAIQALEPGLARFVITPAVGGGAEPFTSDLRQLAAARPGEVLCILGKMERGYLETMGGATYCVMPSMYEPFGGATEPYLKGTPVVARATGGLVHQVVDIQRDRRRATGVLYREEPPEATEEELGLLWRELLHCGEPLARCENPLYIALVEALTQALRQAIQIYQQDPDGYAGMLANLHAQALQFSWSKAAAEYGVLYDLAVGSAAVKE